jgi:type I site-specific restriction endonuclease
MAKPLTEAEARKVIDEQLCLAGWVVQDRPSIDLAASRGVAVEEFPTDEGPADYLLFVDGKAAGICEAKRPGQTLSEVELQVKKYRRGFESLLKKKAYPHWSLPLPFTYISTGYSDGLAYSRPCLGRRPPDRDDAGAYRGRPPTRWRGAVRIHAAGARQGAWAT